MQAAYAKSKAEYYSKKLEGIDSNTDWIQSKYFYRLNESERIKFLAYAFTTYEPGRFDGETAFTFSRYLSNPNGSWHYSSEFATDVAYMNRLFDGLESLPRSAIDELATGYGGSSRRYDTNLKWWKSHLQWKNQKKSEMAMPRKPSD